MLIAGVALSLPAERLVSRTTIHLGLHSRSPLSIKVPPDFYHDDVTAGYGFAFARTARYFLALKLDDKLDVVLPVIC